MIVQAGLTLAVALAGGAAFSVVRMPLPWLLGPLAGVVVWRNVFGGRPCWPVGLRNAGLVILGYLIGRSFTPEAARQIAAQYPEMLLVTALTIGFSLLVGYIACRWTGESLASCIIGGVPGGLSQMTVLSEEIRAADVTIVTFMHTIRMLAVVFCVPLLVVADFAAGWPAGTAAAAAADLPAGPAGNLLHGVAVTAGTWLAVRFNWPTPYLLGPVAGACLLTLNGLTGSAVPPAAVIAAQLSLGTYLGLTVRLGKLEAAWRRVLPFTLLNVALAILFSLFLGWLLSRFTAMSVVTGFLCTAPGGMAEMSLTAMLVNADLPTVVAYQLFRVLFILLILPVVFKRWLC